ncbi:RHS repeat protein [Hazenella sp. IB182357]|uniref:RHS repeat protein n=1 Tax=Polycladospora coralii TaxID=2771432 RepID=A0A926N870_9BACL|nr:DNRLRE domain-containing protein [Polycladospora coralii]MBD1371037.1 RHS repeat protein [Polycladospora coralii]
MQIFYEKKYLWFRRSLSWLLMFALIITMMPTDVFAKKAINPPKTASVKKELREHRTETTKLIDNGNGTLSKQIYFDPIHQKVDGEWEEKSTEIVTTSKGTLKPETATINAEFLPQMEKGKYAIIRSGKHSLTYTFLGAEGMKTAQDVAATHEENQVRYPNVMEGIHIQNTLYDTFVKEDIILEKQGTENVFHFQLQTDLKAKELSDGSVIFEDSQENEIFKLPKPYMVDSNIDPKSDEPARSDDVKYEIKQNESGWVLTVTADPDWLKDPTRVYPIYIDPTTTVATSSASGDTFVASAYPTTNYENFKESSGYYSLKVGNYDSTTGTNYAYLKQDLSSLKDVVVDSASLNVYTAHSYYPTTPTRVWVDAVNSTWNATTLTWNSASSITSSNIAYDDVYKGQWANFNVTNTVKAWLSSPPTKTNYGFKLHANGNGQTYWKKFYSSENSSNQPYLSITYHLPTPNTPTGITYANWVGSDSGFVDLNWDAIPGATGYYVWIFNGKEYQKFDVGNVTSWSTHNKGIWPTTDEITAGKYLLHTDGKGTELARDPSPVYKNSGGIYPTRTNYWFRVSAKHPTGETPYSAAYMPTIQTRSEDLGEEEFWQYGEVPGGKVNTVTGNFIASETDARTDGRGPAVNISRTYNSRSQEDGIFGLAWTWGLGIQFKEDESGNAIFTDEDGTVHQFTKNADGNYTKPLGVYLALKKESNGYTLTDKDQTVYAFDLTGRLTQIQDANKNTVKLTYNTAKQLTVIQDASGRETQLTYDANGKVVKVTDPASHIWHYAYEDGKLISVTDPEGGITRYGYTENQLTSIQDPNHTEEKPAVSTYVYTDGRLTHVKDQLGRETTVAYDIGKSATVRSPTQKKTEYGYNVSGNPTKVVVDPGGLQLTTTYTYDHNNLTETKDANTNKAGSTAASESYQYDSNGNVTQATDASGTEKYQYNSNNDVTTYTDAKGKDYKYTYDGTNEVSSTDPAQVSDAKVYDANGNVISSTKELGLADNLAINGDMERVSANLPQNWAKAAVYDGGSLITDASAKYSGTQSVKFTTSSTATTEGTLGYIGATQIIPVEPGTTYTFSGFIKTSNLTNAKAFFNVQQLLDESGTVNPSNQWTDNRFSKLTGTHDWTQRQVTFTTDEETTYVRVYLEVDHTSKTSSGSAWFDGIQLEKGAVSTQFNPLENSSFEDGFSNWYKSGDAGTIDTTESFDGTQSLKMSRSSTSSNPVQYVQNITLNQSTPQPITVTGLSKATGVTNSVDKGVNKDYAVWVDAIQNDGTYVTEQAKFSIGTHDWQRAAVTIQPTKPLNTVRVYVIFRGNNTGTAWFDNIRVQNGQALTTYAYDAKGNNVLKTTDEMGNTGQSTFDEVGNELTSTDAKGNTKTSTYDQNDQLIGIQLPGADVKVNYIHDKNGNINEKRVTSQNGSTTLSTTKFTFDAADQLLAEIDALNHTTNYTYDADGNQTKITQADQSTIEYGYDAADRKTEEKHNGVTRYQYTYDANGNEIGVQDAVLNQAKTRVFDKSNRVTSMTTSGGTMTWSYDANDNLTSQNITNGSGAYTHSYGYNNVDHNNIVTDPTGKVTRLDYDENGNIRTLTYGNGSGVTFIYDANDRITQLTIGKSDGTVIASYTYSYDENDNRTSVTDQTGKTIRYTYDEQNQLLSETDPFTANTMSYTYDALGNRKTKVVKDTNGSTVSSINYSYNALNQLTDVAGQAYTYDENGNLTDDGEKNYTWDVAGRLISIKKKSDGSTIANYDYDEDGRRIRSNVNGTITNYVYDGDSIRVLYETNASNQITRYYTYNTGGTMLSMTKVGGGTYYYHTNAHGDVIAVTDQSNNTVATYTYDAWGNIVSQTGSFADENPYRYAGYRYDRETGLYYLMARYYNPENGNFLSLDPDPGDSDDPQTQNGYNYAINNPVMNMDPDGHFVPVLYYGAVGVMWGYRAYKTYKWGKRLHSAYVLSKNIDWNHIRDRHLKRNRFHGKGKFKSNRTMKRTTRATLRRGRPSEGKYGRIKYEKKFRRYVGRNGNGRWTKRVRVIWDPIKKKVVTSFPY